MQTVLLLLRKRLAVWCYLSFHHLDPVGVIYATCETVINIDQRIVMASEDATVHFLYDFYLNRGGLAWFYQVQFHIPKPVYIHNQGRPNHVCLR